MINIIKLSSITLLGLAIIFTFETPAHGSDAKPVVEDHGDAIVWCQDLDGVPFGDTPSVSYRQLRGTIKGVPFQLALPAEWSGKLLVASHHFLANPLHDRAEDQSDLLLKVISLCRGDAYAMSQEGWDHSPTPEQDYGNFRDALPRLAKAAWKLLREHYGDNPTRTYVAGFSVGGHHAKWIAESFPGLFDGALSLAGTNSAYNWAKFEVASLQAIAENLQSKNICTNPLVPPAADCTPLDLGPDVSAAANEVAPFELHLENGYTYVLHPSPAEAPLAYYFGAALIVPLTIGKLDPAASGDDGVLSWEEILGWDFDTSVSAMQERELRRLDLRGEPRTKLITIIGEGDAIASVTGAIAYGEMVRDQGYGENLREFVLPDIGHLAFFEVPGFFGASIGFQATVEALDALDEWVEEGIEPGPIGGITALTH